MTWSTEVSLTCVRCGEHYPSKYYFKDEGRSEPICNRCAKGGAPGVAITLAPLSAGDYMRSHPPGIDALQNMLKILEWWMESAPVVSDRGKLGAFMDHFAHSWRVSWTKGTRVEVADLFGRCANRDYRQGGHHIIYGLELPYQRYGEIELDTTPESWKGHGVIGSAIELGVAGCLHVVGKAFGNEFFFLAHR